MKRQAKTAVGMVILALGMVLSASCGEEEITPAIHMTETGKETTAHSETEEETTVQQETETQTDETAEKETETEQIPEKEAVKVKGIYVTGPMAGTSGMDDLIALVDETELNTLVIDIKNDDGRITYDMQIPQVQEIGASKAYVEDMPALVQKCKEKGIYLIARVVAFKDPYLAEQKPEWSLHKADGSVFYDKSGLAWVNPYKKEVWDYLVEIGKEAGRIGFDEVQYDYIRFSTDSGMKQVDFGEYADVPKEEAISAFSRYACEELHKEGIRVSADVYGVVIDSKLDAQIVGQDYVEMASCFDAISPMVYPSHYGPYNYNIPIPDADPYGTVLAAMQSSKRVLAGFDMETARSGKLKDADPGESAAQVSGNGTVSAAEDQAVSSNSAESENTGGEVAEGTLSSNQISENTAETTRKISVNGQMMEEKEAILADTKQLDDMPGITASVRPWLQDFTATWVSGHIEYGPEQIRQQIQAVYDAGYEEWILWNAANRYTEGGLLPEESAQETEGTDAAQQTMDGEETE